MAESLARQRDILLEIRSGINAVSGHLWELPPEIAESVAVAEGYLLRTIDQHYGRLMRAMAVEETARNAHV